LYAKHYDFFDFVYNEIKEKNKNEECKNTNNVFVKGRCQYNYYKTFNNVKVVVFEFIESWYNNLIIHSKI